MESNSSDSISIDPAINSSLRLADALSLSQLSVTDSNVYLFDFDGVIASRTDDDIYKLEPTASEAEILSKAAECFGIRCYDMEQRYQRHLLYQAAAWQLKIPIEPGPAFSKAREAARRAQLFILTARSGWHAVERLRQFVVSSEIKPVEIYNVGRVKKDRQVELICREFVHKQVFYIEDSAAHLVDASSIAANNLHLIHVDSDLQPPRAESYLRSHLLETLALAMAAYQQSETNGEHNAT